MQPLPAAVSAEWHQMHWLPWLQLYAEARDLKKKTVLCFLYQLNSLRDGCIPVIIGRYEGKEGEFLWLPHCGRVDEGV